MAISPLAGKPAPQEILVDVARLEREYYAHEPDPEDPAQRVAFGTSGHRGSSLSGSFCEAHILAMTQAVCDYRRSRGIDGPLYLGKDTHALSGPAQRTALEVLAANGVETVIQQDDGFTPTPVISRAILVYNRGRAGHRADGIVVTPSHNPPRDGGFKYNPPSGGPADATVTGWIQDRANELLRGGRRSRETGPLRERAGCRDHARAGPRRPVRERPRQRRRHGRDPVGPTRARGGPARRRRGALLGADRRRLRPRHPGREPEGRSDVLLHERGSRRRDPHGLLEPVGDGPADRPQGPLPGRVRERHRRRPARDRHPLGRAAEPESLSRRRHPLSADPQAGSGRRVRRSARPWCPAA